MFRAVSPFDPTSVWWALSGQAVLKQKLAMEVPWFGLPRETQRSTLPLLERFFRY